jgi:hypothetical protein
MKFLPNAVLSAPTSKIFSARGIPPSEPLFGTVGHSGAPPASLFGRGSQREKRGAPASSPGRDPSLLSGQPVASSFRAARAWATRSSAALATRASSCPVRFWPSGGRWSQTVSGRPSSPSAALTACRRWHAFSLPQTGFSHGVLRIRPQPEQWSCLTGPGAARLAGCPASTRCCASAPSRAPSAAARSACGCLSSAVLAASPLPVVRVHGEPGCAPHVGQACSATVRASRSLLTAHRPARRRARSRRRLGG